MRQHLNSISTDINGYRPGDQSSRTLHYKNFLIKLLKERNVKTVHDMACGTGIDSVMLLESGFDVSVKLIYEDTSSTGYLFDLIHARLLPPMLLTKC